MEIELWSGVTKAIIDPRGAWITNLSDDRGDILFPKRNLKAPDGTMKIRGGCHVCLPNFGPGGNSGQPQHGFGRIMDWEIIEQTDSRIVMQLASGGEGYEDLRSTLRYDLHDASITMELEVTNAGEEELHVAPAFHPYFAVLGGSRVIIDDEEQSIEELAQTLFVSGVTQRLQLPNREVSLSSKQLSLWAKWTDRLGAYVCVEPTAGGYTFLKEMPDESELLGLEQTRKYSLVITWQ